MIKTKHTPGPWKMDKDERVGGWAILQKETNPNSICMVRDEVNAQLIAAAPELLEALKELQFVIKKFGIREPNNLTQCFGAMDKAKRAINKTEETK